MIDNFIIFLILYITAFFLGIFAEWIITRPEPKIEPKTEVCHAYNKEEWDECMKNCGAYYKDNGEIWDNNTAVIDVKKKKKKKK